MLKRKKLRKIVKKPRRIKKRRDPLRDNPAVGGMSEAQAERLLEELRRRD